MTISKEVIMLPEHVQVPETFGSWGTHSFHKYIASYAPELVDIYLKLGWAGCTVYDPFMGGGTTGVEALRHKMNFYGTDLSPFAYFLNKVKTTQIPDIREKTEDYLSFMNEFYRNVYGTTGLGAFMGNSQKEQETSTFDTENIKMDKHKLKSVEDLFTSPNFEALIRIRRSIRKYCDWKYGMDSEKLETENSPLYRFLMCGLSSILRPCSSITSGRQALNYLVREAAPGRNLDPWTEFPRRIQQMTTIMEKYNQEQIGKAHILMADARKAPIPDDSIDLVITSPPYGDAIHYDKEEKLSFAFLDFDVTRFHNWNIGKKGQVISERMLPRLKYTIISPSADKALNQMVEKKTIKAINVSRTYSVYFNDIVEVWRNLWRITRKGAKVCWCVGNNTREDVYCDNVRIAEEIAKSLGFVHLKTSLVTGFELFKIDRESVVLVEKP